MATVSEDKEVRRVGALVEKEMGNFSVFLKNKNMTRGRESGPHDQSNGQYLPKGPKSLNYKMFNKFLDESFKIKEFIFKLKKISKFLNLFTIFFLSKKNEHESSNLLLEGISTKMTS
jgi:hypothetical protein